VQRCHSKKIKKPIWANKKTQENPRPHFNTFSLNFWKKSYFSRQNPQKNSISSPKISDDLFLVIDSHFQNFYPPFPISNPFWP